MEFKNLNTKEKKNIFIKIILQCGIPEFINKNGCNYKVNGFNKDSCKEFWRLYDEDGLDIKKMIYVLWFYYNSSKISFPKNIANFINSGEFEGYYYEIDIKAQNGEIEYNNTDREIFDKWSK